MARFVARSRACSDLVERTSARAVRSLVDDYEAAPDILALEADVVVALEAVVWRDVLLPRAARVDASAVRSGRCTEWAARYLSRWPRVSAAFDVRVSRSGVAVSLCSSPEAGEKRSPLPRVVSRLASEFAGAVEVERAAEGAVRRGSIRVVRCSSDQGSRSALARGCRACRAVMVRAPSQRGLGLAGSRELARLVEARGRRVLAVPDADRLGRQAAPGVADLLAVMGVGVRLGAPDLEGLWRPGSARAEEDARLDGLCVGPRSVLGPGVVVRGDCVLARPPRGVRPRVTAVGGPDRPLVVLAALCARLLPDRPVLLRAGGSSPARLEVGARSLPADLRGFASFGGDAAVLERARSVVAEALSERHDAAASAVLAASSRARGRQK